MMIQSFTEKIHGFMMIKNENKNKQMTEFYEMVQLSVSKIMKNWEFGFAKNCPYPLWRMSFFF